MIRFLAKFMWWCGYALMSYAVVLLLFTPSQQLRLDGSQAQIGLVTAGILLVVMGWALRR